MAKIHATLRHEIMTKRCPRVIRVVLVLATALVGAEACSTHLTSTDAQAEEANRTLAWFGYQAHASDEGGVDKLRYAAIYCSSRGILTRAGVDASADGRTDGPPCPEAHP
jgi:hypothetical protein